MYQATYKLSVAIIALVASCGVSAAQSKVAYLPCGQINDHSWSEAGYLGMMAAKDERAKKGTPITVDYTESLQPAQAEAAARDYASRGYNPVVIHCGTLAGAAYNAAKAFPGTTFLTSNPPDATDLPKNLWIYDASQQEAAFIAGYLAGLVSKSGRVGAIGGFDFPALARQVEGFRLGARYAKPTIKSFGVYINSWEDAGKAKEAAQAQIDSGADVIFAATDQAARGVFVAAENAGVYAIAAYSEQSSLAPKAILGSVLFDYPRLLSFMVVNALDNKLEVGKFYRVGMAGGVGELARNSALYDALPADVKKKYESAIEDIKSGKLQIPELTKANQSDGFDLAKLTAK
jgi:basic membrane lipoprotein Med (substrate-binding protein (PBP1-ABC) superfamily)